MIKKYTIKKGNLELTVLNIGAVIYELKYLGKNVVINFKDLDFYKENNSYIGCVVGRSAGRIKEPKLNGLDLDLNFREKFNLHGNNLHRVEYDVEVIGNKIELKYFDAAGKFPGNMDIKITYEIIDNSIKQVIETSSDAPTIHNFTNHSYFNLGFDSILDHKLEIKAKEVCELDSNLLPIGKINVENTAFDFQETKLIRDNFNKGDKQFEYSKFIDHPYKLEGDIRLVGKNIAMKINTNREYVVCYMGNYMSEVDGISYDDYSAVCLETQKVPNNVDFVKDDYSETYFTFETL